MSPLGINRRLAGAFLLLSPFALAQTGHRPPPAAPKQSATEPTGPTVLIDTSMGRLTCRLYATQAPELTANFVGLAQGSEDWKDPASGELQHGKPFYDGTGLFGSTDAIGGGDRMGSGKGTAGDPLPALKPNGLIFDRPGRLAMSVIEGKLSRSMFFITQHADAEIGRAGRGVIFGQCDPASSDKVAEISHTLLSVDNHPAKPISINKISVIQQGDPLPPIAPDVPSASVLPQPMPYPGLDPMAPDPTGPTALIDTTFGPISCRLFDKEAPVATKTFIGLAEGTRDWTMPGTHAVMNGKPFYNGLLFNRVIPDFMIQNQNYPGGSTGGGDIGIKYSIEVVPGLNFDRPGRLAMANSGPDTNDSSFFITDAPRHGGLDEHFTIFGQCDDASVKIVAAIARVPRDAHNRPLKPVSIRKVTITRPDQKQP
jgi:cyclophilin family peptidyl-prolyl cis-trans isomerase